MEFKKFKTKVLVLSHKITIPIDELMQWKFKDVITAMELLNIL